MFTTFLISTVLGASALLAAPSDAPKKARGGGMCQKLECTDDQAEAIKQIRAVHKEQVKGTHAKAKELRAAMKAEFAKPVLDTTKIKALHAELQSIHGTMADARLDAKLGTLEVLTPEQRAKAAKRMGKHKHKRFGKRRGKGERKGFSKGRRGGSRSDKSERPGRADKAKRGKRARRGGNGVTAANR